jgi:hypothetical protein
MKKLMLTLLLMAFSSILVIAQGCLPDGISFPTQSRNDNFQTNYRGCTGNNVQVVVIKFVKYRPEYNIYSVSRKT